MSRYSPKAQYEKRGIFFVGFFHSDSPPPCYHRRVLSRHGSLLEMAPCRIFAKFPARTPITSSRRMKKHLSASGKEVRSASWHLFLRIFANILRNNRGSVPNYHSPRTESFLFSVFHVPWSNEFGPIHRYRYRWNNGIMGRDNSSSSPRCSFW